MIIIIRLISPHHLNLLELKQEKTKKKFKKKMFCVLLSKDLLLIHLNHSFLKSQVFLKTFKDFKYSFSITWVLSKDSMSPFSFQVIKYNLMSLLILRRRLQKKKWRRKRRRLFFINKKINEIGTWCTRILFPSTI